MHYLNKMTLFLIFHTKMNIWVSLPADEELHQFMSLAKLQLPTKRRVEEEKLTQECQERDEPEEKPMEELNEFNPISCGREKFGIGTRCWPQFTDEACLEQFLR